MNTKIIIVSNKEGIVHLASNQPVEVVQIELEENGENQLYYEDVIHNFLDQSPNNKLIKSFASEENLAATVSKEIVENSILFKHFNDQI